jgi:hypothetical protein
MTAITEFRPGVGNKAALLVVGSSRTAKTIRENPYCRSTLDGTNLVIADRQLARTVHNLPYGTVQHLLTRRLVRRRSRSRPASARQYFLANGNRRPEMLYWFYPRQIDGCSQIKTRCRAWKFPESAPPMQMLSPNQSLWPTIMSPTATPSRNFN